MKNPLIQFSLNETKDIWKIKEFLLRVSPKGGTEFLELVYQRLPELKEIMELPKNIREKEIEKYVKNHYKKHCEKLALAVEETTTEWSEFAPKFFISTNKIFKNMEWPEGEYQGYLSICPPYPRFLHSKTFQFSHRKSQMRIYGVAHEMWHFMFYEYIRKRYTPQLSNTLEGEMNELSEGKFKIPLWSLSEAFNIVLLSKEFGEGVGWATGSYTQLIPYLDQVTNTWEECGGDIDEFFTKMEA